MGIVFESYFCYWCMLLCYCTFLLGGFLGYARNDTGGVFGWGSFVYRSGRQGKIRGSFGYAQDDIGVRLRLREVLRFRRRCTQDDTGEKEHVALSGTQVESNGSQLFNFTYGYFLVDVIINFYK